MIRLLHWALAGQVNAGPGETAVLSTISACFYQKLLRVIHIIDVCLPVPALDLVGVYSFSNRVQLGKVMTLKCIERAMLKLHLNWKIYQAITYYSSHTCIPCTSYVSIIIEFRNKCGINIDINLFNTWCFCRSK